MKKHILILFGLIVFNNGIGQIQKIFNTENPDSNNFGTVVSIYGEFALVENNDFFGVDIKRDYDLHIFKRTNTKWKEIQALKTFIRYEAYKKKSSIIYSDMIISDNLANAWANDKYIYVMKYNDLKFELIDSIKVGERLMDFGIKAFNGNWIMFHIIDHAQSLSANYFYYMENDKWVLRDSFNYDFFNSQVNIKSILSKNYAILPSINSIIIYKRNNDHWHQFQEIFKPFKWTYQQSLFHMDVSMSPDEKWIATTEIDTLGVPYMNSSYVNIYKMTNEKWELFQEIRNIGEDSLAFGRSMSIWDKDLLIGSPLDYGGKGTIYHYTLKNGIWQLKGEIKPPFNDTLYGYFGSNIDRYKETVIVGAEKDKTYNYAPGAAYIFQIPARDTLTAGICEGEGYTFNDTVIYDAGHYTDTLLASYGVDSVVQLYLTVYPKEQVEIDTILCDDESLMVGDSLLTEEGVYTINLKNIHGCDSIVTARIEYDNLEVTDSITADYGCQNGEIKLMLQGNNPPYAFKWNTGDSGEDISGLSKGEYSVTITSESGCEYDYEYQVGDSIPYLIPNAFFPSGQEELNSIFKPYTAKDVHVLDTEIYDRWGEKVFSGTEDEYWDGTYQGKASPPGIYLYRIEIDSPCGKEVKTGQVVLMR